MGERDLLPASIRSGANFNLYPQFSRIEDQIASLKYFCTASTKSLLMQCLLHKYKSSIVDVRLNTKYASDKLSFSSYSQVSAFLQTAIFLIFHSKKPLHCSQHWLKQYTAKQKMISKNLLLIQSKELAETSKISTSWNFKFSWMVILNIFRS